MAYDLERIADPRLREIFELIMNITSGHDHDGANSKAVTVGGVAPDIITNAMVKSDAAIAFSKLAASTDISTAGKVVDLTIAGEVNGDVLYFDGTNWVHKAATELPAATSSSLADSVNIDGGANDVQLVTTAQTVGTANLTIPDFANIDQVLATTELAQVFKSKTLDDATTKFGDTADPTKDLFFSLGGATADKTMTIVSSQSDDRTLTLPNTTDTLVGKATTDVFTNKTLDDATVKFGDTADNTKDLFISLGGATADKTMTIVSSQTDDRSLTLPDATDTLMGKATSDVMTNKTLDSAATGNVLKNVVLAYAGTITRAEMITGKVLVADKASVAIKVLSVKALVTGGFNSGAGTSFILEDTNGAPVNILTALKAALTNGARISTEGLAIANVSEGAGMTGALTSGKGIAVAADAAWDAGTNINIVIEYMYT
jgi:hypothetical protein